MPDQAEHVPPVIFGVSLRADCGNPDHEWVRCTGCPNGDAPCACTGRICCQREYFELFGD